MGKYSAVIFNSIKKNLAYRASNFIAMVSIVFSFGILFYFWTSIYRQGNQVGSYSLREIISYYIFIAVFDMLFTANTAWGIGEEIRNGQITTSLLMPMKHLEYKFSQTVGALFYRIMFYGLIIALMLFLMRNFLTHPRDRFGYVLFLVVALAAYVLNFLIYYIVGIFSFWMMDNTGFFYACFVIVSFMQGQWMPLDLLPNWFIVVANYLPFKYLFFVPVGIASGRTAFEFSMLIIPIFWCVVLYLLAGWLYKKGIKKYEGYGI